MLSDQTELRKIIHTVTEILKADGLSDLCNLLSNAKISAENTDYDNWNGGTNLFTVYLHVEVDVFVKFRAQLEQASKLLLDRFQLVTGHIENERFYSVAIIPVSEPIIDWSKIAGIYSKNKLIEDINYLRNVMVSVSTGGPRIPSVNNEYVVKYSQVDKALQKLNITNKNPFKDLWQWHGKWSKDFPTYHERRIFIGGLFDSLIKVLEEDDPQDGIQVTVDLTDWEKIKRSIQEIRIRNREAETEEQFQAVGLLCREVIVTLAQTIFVKEKHPILDGTIASNTDAKRMIEAYISAVLGGSSNEALRKYARATLDLANDLTHRRTALKKNSLLCANATFALVNFIGIIEEKI